MITCGDFATAVARFEGRSIQLSAGPDVLASVSLRKMSGRELRDLINSYTDQR
jgi:hypothetical protein